MKLIAWKERHIRTDNIRREVSFYQVLYSALEEAKRADFVQAA